MIVNRKMPHFLSEEVINRLGLGAATMKYYLMPMDHKMLTIRLENLDDIFDQNSHERETLTGP